MDTPAPAPAIPATANESKEDGKEEDGKNNGKGSANADANASASKDTPITSTPAPAPTTPAPALAPVLAPAPTETPLETSTPADTSSTPAQASSAQPSSTPVPVSTATPETSSGADGVSSGSPDMADESEADKAPAVATTPITGDAHANETDNEKSRPKNNENEHAEDTGNGSDDAQTHPATTEPQHQTTAPEVAPVPVADAPPAQPSLVVAQPVVSANAIGNGEDHEEVDGTAGSGAPTTTTATEPQVDPSVQVDASVVVAVASPAQPSLVVAQPAQLVVSGIEPSTATALEGDSSEFVESHDSKDHRNGGEDTKSGQFPTSPEQPVVSAAPLGETHGVEGESLPPIASYTPGTTSSVTAGHPSNTAAELSSSSQVPSEEQPGAKGGDGKTEASPEANSMPVASVESFPTDKSTAVTKTNSGTPTSSSESTAKAPAPQLGGVQVALSEQGVPSTTAESKAKGGDPVSNSRSEIESGQHRDVASTATEHAEERNEARPAEHAEVRNETRSSEHDSSIAVASLVFDANSKSPVRTVDKQLQLSESSDQLVSKDPSKSATLNSTPASTVTEEPEKYVRGQSIESQLTMEGKGDDGTTLDKDLPQVLGGKQHGVSKHSSASASGVHFYESVRYSTSLAAGMSLALLVCFHFMFMDPRLSWTSALWSPNSWEFVLYTKYLQQATSLSALTLLKTPYFLWEFTDTFSWTNFLIQRDESGESNSSGTRRRLRTIALDGLVGYSDRIGQDENKIMYHCVVGFVVAMGIVFMAFLAVTAVGKWGRLTETRSVARRILGLSVLVWCFSLFPLSLTASFEMQMEVQANLIETWPMSLSVLALFGVCSAGVAYGARVVLHNSEKELRRSETVAVWGVLYAHYTHPTRMFFMLGASVQIVVGICIGVFGSSSTLLVLLVAIQLLYLVAVYTIEPFVNRVVLVATYAVGAVTTVNLGLAFAFLQSSELSSASRDLVANVYLGINALVIYVWLIRLLVVFCSCVVVWSDRKHSASSIQSGMFTKDAPRGVLQVEPSIRDAPEEHGYRMSISPAECAQTTAMALAPDSSSQIECCEQWERVVDIKYTEWTGYRQINQARSMFIKRNDEEGTTPTGHEDSVELKKMLTSCMINRQILVRSVALDWMDLCATAHQEIAWDGDATAAAVIRTRRNQSCNVCVAVFVHEQCCVAGVLIGIPISIQRKSYKPFAILGVLGSFVDYSVPYTNDCRLIHNAMQLALQQERQRDAAAKTLTFGDDTKE